MAARLIACRNRITEAEQVISDRALAAGVFPHWQPIAPEDAAHVDALKPPPAEPETPAPTAASAVEPTPAPAPNRRKAASGHDNEKE